MKNKLILLALLFVSYFADAQKYIQTFTKTDGNEVAISLQNIAFVSPSGDAGGSVLMTGPTPKAVYVTDTLATIVSGSAAMLVELTEIRSAGNRQVGVSKQHVQEIVPSGASQTLLKLKNPVISVLVSGAFSVIADSLAAESGGGAGNTDITFDGASSVIGLESSTGTGVFIAEGGSTTITQSGDTLTVTGANSIYTGSDTIPVATLAAVTEDPEGNTMDFAIGVFPEWPDMNQDGTERGFFYGINYWTALGLVHGTTAVELYDDEIIMFANFPIQGATPGGRININEGVSLLSQQTTSKSEVVLAPVNDNTFSMILQSTAQQAVLYVGLGDPNGVLTANSGSIYLRTDGGAGTSFYVKETDGVNTGWVGK